MNSGHVALVVSIAALLVARRSAKLVDDYLREGERQRNAASLMLGFARTKEQIDKL